jgi:tetratricopeptide (TPR) repeat protein
MTADGRPLLLDFNLSVDAALPAWKVGGTLPYMPPEELANLASRKAGPHPFRYDARSDLFSLGIIVYELLTGELPFGAIPRDGPLDQLANGLRQQQARGPLPIRSLNRQVDRQLARLVESCLAFEPERRPQTAQQLADAFRRALSPVRRGRRWIGIHRAQASGVGLALLTVFVAASLFFALRPPYAVRQFRLGLDHLGQGEYSLAVDALDSSIRANPTSGRALFARGRAYQRLGQFQAAFHDYDSAEQLAPSPVLYACKGYCLNRSKFHKDAIAAYHSALKAGYDRPALLYSNIGFSHFMLGEIDEAEKNFRRALQLDGALATARYWMLNVFLRRAMQAQPVPDAALVDAAKAVEIGPPSATLYHVVAALYAIAARKNPKLVQPAVEYVGKAVQCGCNPRAFTSDTSFSALERESSFLDALKKPSLVVQPPPAVQLLDPLDAL